MQMVTDVLKSIATSIPETWNHADALKYAGTGAGIGGLLGFLLSDKKRRWRNAALGAGALGLGGLGAYTLKQNVLEHTGGLYTGKDRKKPMLPVISTNSDAPKQHYIVYMPGAGTEKRVAPDVTASNTAVIPYGDTDTAVRFINSLRPQDTVSLIGFSMGGGSALKVAEQAKHPILSLHTLDPVSSDPLQAAKVKLFGWKKPDTVSYWKNIRPKNYDAPTIPNAFVRRNPLVLGNIAPKQDNVLVDDDHALWSTGLRINEHRADSLNLLRLALSAVLQKGSGEQRAKQSGRDDRSRI